MKNPNPEKGETCSRNLVPMAFAQLLRHYAKTQITQYDQKFQVMSLFSLIVAHSYGKTGYNASSTLSFRILFYISPGPKLAKLTTSN